MEDFFILELADDLFNDCQMEEYDDYKDPIWEAKYVRMDYDFRSSYERHGFKRENEVILTEMEMKEHNEP